MKRILLPTDFSPNSLNAIHYAMKMFERNECDFYLLNVLKASTFISDDLMTMAPVDTLYKSLIDSSEKRITSIISKIKEDNKDKMHRYHVIVDYDNFIDSINQTCESKKIDLIIMGTKGASGLEKKLFGSNTIRVIQRCSTPVLAIPDKCGFNGFEKIAFTSNYLTAYSLKDLDPLYTISRKFDSKIKILHIENNKELSAKQENNREVLDSCFENLIHEFVDLDGTNIFETISQYISKNSINLLAMISKKHPFFERLFVTHNVEIFAFRINVPLLVM